MTCARCVHQKDGFVPRHVARAPAILRTRVRDIYSTHRDIYVHTETKAKTTHKKDMSLHTTTMIQRTNKDIADNIEILCNATQNVSENERAVTSYVLQKTLRIASATLLISDIMETDSPIRTALQKTAIRLVEHASLSVTDVRVRSSLDTEFRTLSTLFDTALLARTLAESNVAIMQQEIMSLTEFIITAGWGEGSRILTDALFHVANPTISYETDEYKGQQRSSEGRAFTAPRSAPHARDARMSMNSYAPVRDSHVATQTSVKQVTQDAQKDRRAVILTVLQKKDRITIKDITTVIRDVSDKTIQRELLGLVAQGVLVKEGERRWSTYRLA